MRRELSVLARHSCQKKLSQVELTDEQVKQSAAGCKAKGDALDSAECRRDATTLFRQIQSAACEDALWRGAEEWDRPSKDFASCKTGVACCEEPAKKANADCDAAASGAARRASILNE